MATGYVRGGLIEAGEEDPAPSDDVPAEEAEEADSGTEFDGQE